MFAHFLEDREERPDKFAEFLVGSFTALNVRLMKTVRYVILQAEHHIKKRALLPFGVLISITHC